MSDTSSSGSSPIDDADTRDLPPVLPEIQPNAKGFVKAEELLQKGHWRRKTHAWALVLNGSALYFLFAIWSFAGFSMPNWFALLCVVVVLTTLVVNLVIVRYIKGVEEQSTLSPAHLKVRVLVRGTTPNLGCKVGPELLAEILRIMTPDQVTRKVKEQILHAERRTGFYLWAPIIVIGLLGLAVSGLLLWLTISPHHPTPVSHVVKHPKHHHKHSTDGIHPVVPGGWLPTLSVPHFGHLPIGAAMLAAMLTAYVIMAIWVKWQSTVIVVTDNYLRKVVRYPEWFFFTRGETPGVPLRKIDFSEPKVSPLATMLKRDFGQLGTDTAARADDVAFARIRGVRHVVDVSGLCLAHSQR